MFAQLLPELITMIEEFSGSYWRPRFSNDVLPELNQGWRWTAFDYVSTRFPEGSWCGNCYFYGHNNCRHGENIHYEYVSKQTIQKFYPCMSTLDMYVNFGFWLEKHHPDKWEKIILFYQMELLPGIKNSKIFKNINI